MNQDQWSAVDDYLINLFVGTDPALDATLQDSEAANLPPIAVSPPQGKFLLLLAQLAGARRILEIGTLAGYSTICMARALANLDPTAGPAPKLITLEYDPKHAAIARKNFTRANVDHLIELREGPALASLEKIANENQPPFDMFFIDADKQNNPHYLEWAIRLSHVGSLIIIDNAVREGAILNPPPEDTGSIGTRKCLDLMSRDPRLSATALQTVGSKGYDGLAFARVINK